jgi:hypothetical protein
MLRALIVLLSDANAPGPLFWIAGVAFVAFTAVFLCKMIRAVYRYRGLRVVRCPENFRNASVHLDVPRAALTGLVGPPELLLDACSRWPEKRNCGQECLQQLEVTPEDCLVRMIAAKWYLGKQCVYCGRSTGQFHWPDFRSALLLPSGKTAEWREVSAEDLAAVLEHTRPVCWNCHIAERSEATIRN